MAQLSLAALISIARSEQLISFPTDTVPALAARPNSAEKIYIAKGRDKSKPLILMGATARDLWPFVQNHLPAFETWKAIAATYWPGAVTLVLPSSPWIPDQMHPRTPKTIGVRVPNCEIAQTILQQTGPLATTSINKSGQDALISLSEIKQEFPNVLTPTAKFWPQNPQPSQPSTVVEWQENNWIVHRQGSVQFKPEAEMKNENPCDRLVKL